MKFDLAEHLAIARASVNSWQAWEPAKRITICESAATNYYIKQPGSVPGFWSPTEAPYMVEPMNMLASREHESVVFVGPARTGKTAGLILGLFSHAVCSDPGDMLIMQMSREKAREFSLTDLDRCIRYSDNIRERMSESSHADNTHDKRFKNGMFVRIGWPTIGNLSGSTYRYGVVTDLDRIENAENVDGEGPLFEQLTKRTTTFMSRGMALAESSPGIAITDPNFVPTGEHEGPNVTGIVGLYNAGDRRRYYWPCPNCHHHFKVTSDLSYFRLPTEEQLIERIGNININEMAVEYNRIFCPKCNTAIGPRAKKGMNLAGRWLREGQYIDLSGYVRGNGRSAVSASYWIGGIAAAYQPWTKLLIKYLEAIRNYATTDSEEKLKTTTTLDQGGCYMSQAIKLAQKNAVDPADRKEHDLVQFVCPEQTRFLAASVDVQGGNTPRFIVQVNAIGPFMEQWPVTRFTILESKREGSQGPNGPKAPIDPAKYVEDWDLITEKVLRASFRTQITDMELCVRMVAVDSGGEEGVTERAYGWYRYIRDQGYAGRVILVKGFGVKAASNMPVIQISMVGNRSSDEEGDIPLLKLNVNVLKDSVNAGLKRSKPGPGYIHIPAWYTQAQLDEFKSEIRNDEDGTWTQIRARNEAWDLHVYIRAACLHLGADRIDWSEPPSWARPVPDNDQCITSEQRRLIQANDDVLDSVIDATADVKSIAKNQNLSDEQVVQAYRRQVIRSKYVHS